MCCTQPRFPLRPDSNGPLGERMARPGSDQAFIGGLDNRDRNWLIDQLPVAPGVFAQGVGRVRPCGGSRRSVDVRL
jgi:hypothetical protein